MKIIFSPRCLEYKMNGHPESPDRVRLSYEYLKEKGYNFSEVEPCSEEDVLAVHSQELVQKIKAGDFFDYDTPALPKIYEYGLLAAGSAISAMELALRGEGAFSLMRPPGHHATRDNLGGFCYFNNMAIAIRKAMEGGSKTAIIDIDCHHGNGTEDIFLNEKQVIYISLHQSPLYPGTGLKSNKNCFNYPLPPNTGIEEYLSYLKMALGEVENFGPDIIGVSAGFDTYKNDPITNILLEVDTYGEIGKMIKGLHKPVFTVLEGGYDRDIPLCIEKYLEGIGQ